MSETFIELLISCVQNSRVLWDMRHKEYHNRLRVGREWARIAEDLQEEKEVVKAKWKNLRDKFKKELNKIPKARSGDDGDHASGYTGTWCHFESMMFLKSICTPKLTEGNIDVPHDISNSSCSIQVSQEDETKLDESQPIETKSPGNSDNEESQPNTPSISHQPTKRANKSVGDNFKRKMDEFEDSLPDKNSENNPILITRKRKRQTNKQENIEEEFLKLEARKVSLLEQNEEDDEDINFFKSLLPHVKQLPSINKLYFRSRVQNLLATEIINIKNKELHTSNLESYQHSGLSNEPLPPSNSTTCSYSAPISPREFQQSPQIYSSQCTSQNDLF